jgi:predicted Zn-dependent peptidase
MSLLKESAAGAMLAVDAMPNSSSVSMSIWLPYGSRNEKPQHRGFFHYIEHMLFKGTSDKNARQLARIFESTGGFVNAFSERSATCIHCTMPADNWREACRTMLDMAFLSVFPAEEFEKEKVVIISEILQTEDDPEESAHEHFFHRFWPGQTVGLPIAAQVDEVSAITRDSLYEFYLTVFRPEFACISIAGRFLEEEAVDFVERLLERIAACRRAGPLLGSRDDGLLASVPAVAETFRLYEKNSSSLSYIIHGIQTIPPADNRAYLSSSIVNEIFGGSTISRLFQRLREDGGLCYTVFSSYEAEKTEGVWIIHLQTSKKQLPSALDMLEDEIARFAQEPPSPEEYEDACRRMAGLMKLAMDDSEYRQRRMARQYFAHGSIESVEQELAQLGAIEYDEIVLAAANVAASGRARFVFGAVPQAKLMERGYLEYDAH